MANVWHMLHCIYFTWHVSFCGWLCLCDKLTNMHSLMAPLFYCISVSIPTHFTPGLLHTYVSVKVVYVRIQQAHEEIPIECDC